jgi:hypothetical protein
MSVWKMKHGEEISALVMRGESISAFALDCAFISYHRNI